MAIKDELRARARAVEMRGAKTRARSLHTLSPRQQFGADLLISIATFTAVGDGDIMKIDCHKKATVQQKEGDRNRGVSRSAAALLAAGWSRGLEPGVSFG